jgi:hypothetical protein
MAEPMKIKETYRLQNAPSDSLNGFLHDIIQDFSIVLGKDGLVLRTLVDVRRGLYVERGRIVPGSAIGREPDRLYLQTFDLGHDEKNYPTNQLTDLLQAYILR